MAAEAEAAREARAKVIQVQLLLDHRYESLIFLVWEAKI